MSIANTIVTLIKGSGLVDVYIGNEPTDKNCVTIYDTGGGPQNPKFALDDLDFQIRVNDLSYQNGIDKIDKIRLLLEGITPFNDGGYRVLGIWCMTAPMFIGRGPNQRSLFTANFKASREAVKDEARGNREFLTNPA